jgi:hypothetical protein
VGEESWSGLFAHPAEPPDGRGGLGTAGTRCCGPPGRGIGVKAVVYEGSRYVKVKDIPDAKIEQSTDVLVRITSTPLMQEFSTC